MFTKNHLAASKKYRYQSETSQHHLNLSSRSREKKSLSKTKSNRMFDFYSSQNNHNSISSTIRKYYHTSKNK